MVSGIYKRHDSAPDANLNPDSHSRIINLFVEVTATGLLPAITLATEIASSTTPLRPPGTTRLVNPIAVASVGEKRRPVIASSRASEEEPVILGKRWRVPMSAARPTLTS